MRANSNERYGKSIRASLPFVTSWAVDVRPEFMQCLSAILYGHLGSYLRHAVQQGFL
jgi:hypothetical protein